MYAAGGGLGSDAKWGSLNTQAFVGQEGSQAQVCQMTCPFRGAGILEEPCVRVAPGPCGRNGGRDWAGRVGTVTVTVPQKQNR